MNTSSFSRKLIFILYGVAVSLISLVFFVGTRLNIPFKKITGDPALTFGENPLTGFLSNIGVLFWCATTAILLFTAILTFQKKKTQQFIFFLSSGLLTMILLLDDLFMVHDYLFYSIGWNQYIMYAIYIVLLVIYFAAYTQFILTLPFVYILGLAFFFLGSSVLLDVIFETTNLEYFIEDSLKFLGIVSWFLFYVLNSFKSLAIPITTVST